jgi:hypothetical protein
MGICGDQNILSQYNWWDAMLRKKSYHKKYAAINKVANGVHGLELWGLTPEIKITNNWC